MELICEWVLVSWMRQNVKYTRNHVHVAASSTQNKIKTKQQQQQKVSFLFPKKHAMTFIYSEREVKKEVEKSEQL